jgi:DNA-binding LacI/PurR family transcriptional regulator
LFVFNALADIVDVGNSNGLYMHDSIRKALSHIEKLMAAGRFAGGDRLPRIAELAAGAGVSPRYVCAAVDKLRRRGMVHVVKGRGIFIGAAPVRAARPPRSEPKWHRVYLDLEKGILADAFGAGLFPGINELRRRYRVSFGLVKRVLEKLVESGLVEKSSAGFRRTRAIPALSHASVVFVSTAYESGKIVVLNDRFREANCALERECRNSSITFLRFGVTPAANTGQLSEMIKERSPLGYIVWPNGLSDQQVFAVLSVLTPLQRPIAIIDEIGGFAVPSMFEQTSWIKVLAIAGVTAGMQAGRFLNSLCHKNILYVSPSSHPLWSEQRREGLCRTGSAVTPMDCIEAAPQVPAQSQEMNAAIARVYESFRVPANEFYVKHKAIVETTLLFISGLESLKQDLLPRLPRALRRNEITAIVAANDKFALAVLAAFDELKIRSPGMCSILGFDDIPESYEYELTSYNFSFGAIALQALSFILFPRSAVFRLEGRRIECEGVIMERSTVAKAGASR